MLEGAVFRLTMRGARVIVIEATFRFSALHGVVLGFAVFGRFGRRRT